jgi:hypothetical protein
MKQQFQKDDPDIFDLAWLDDEELHKLQEAMLSYHENAYWLHCLNEQVAIRAGKLRVIPGAEARDPAFKQYPIRDLHAAQLILDAIGSHFKAIGKSIGQRFYEMLVQCCEGALLDHKREFLYLGENSSVAIASNDRIDPPPVGICSHCRDYTRKEERLIRNAQHVRLDSTCSVVEERIGYRVLGARALELPQPGTWKV